MNGQINSNNDRATQGRIIEEHKGIYYVEVVDRTYLARVSGKMMYEAAGRLDYPAVGDWVTMRSESLLGGEAVIEGVLPRKSCFVRKMAGTTSEEQIVAANVDIVFICMALNEDFNLNRLDRYVTLAWESGATPQVILTKSDLSSDVKDQLMQVESRAPGVLVHVVSAREPEAAAYIKARIPQGVTAAFLGSSGVGKSTLINLMLGEDLLETGDIRHDDGKGKHTTTHRQLIHLPDGGDVIDTPGMRELQLTSSTAGIDEAFLDIGAIGSGCRFTDCTHENEPGCAVQKALKSGALDPARYDSYLKLLREAEFMERKSNVVAANAYKKMIIKRNKAAMEHVKYKTSKR